MHTAWKIMYHFYIVQRYLFCCCFSKCSYVLPDWGVDAGILYIFINRTIACIRSTASVIVF